MAGLMTADDFMGEDTTKAEIAKSALSAVGSLFQSIPGIVSAAKGNVPEPTPKPAPSTASDSGGFMSTKIAGMSLPVIGLVVVGGVIAAKVLFKKKR